MLINPFLPLTFLKISSLKTTIFILLILLIKSNLLRLKGGLIGAFFAVILISGLIISSSVAAGSLFYAVKISNRNKSNNFNTDDNLETVNI